LYSTNHPHNLYVKCAITWSVCFGHWANDKTKMGQEKEMYNKYSQLINMNQYSICGNFKRLMEMVENDFNFQSLVALGH